MTATTGEALRTIRVTATCLGTDLLSHTVAAGCNLGSGTSMTAGAVAGLAAGHTLCFLACLVTSEGLGVTLVLLRIGAVCVFETSHTTVVGNITSTTGAVCVGQTSHTLRSLGVAHLTTGAVSVLTTACHTSFGAVADEAAAAVRIFATSNTALGSGIADATHCVVEGSTIGVLRATTGVGCGVTNRSLSSSGAAVAVATVGVVQTLHTSCRGGAGLTNFSGVACSITVTVAGTSQHALTTRTNLTVLAVTVASAACFADFRGRVTDVTQRTVGVGAATFATLAGFANVGGTAGVRGILVGSGAVGISRAVHTLVAGTLEATGAVLGSVSTLDTLAAAGLTSRGRSLALGVAGTLGRDTLVALALLTCLTVAVCVALHTLFGCGVALERSTIGILSTTGSHTHIRFTGLESLTVAVFGASHTLVLSTNRL